MGSLIVPMILLGVLIIFGVVFFAITSAQNKKKSINDSKKNGGSNNKEKKAGAKKASDTIPKEDVFKFMEFDRILDNMIVQNNGTTFTMAIKCKGINYDLMSEVERLAVEEGFITFLNTLRFPIQLYVQAQNIDLKKNVRMYNDRIANLKEEYEDANLKYNEVLDQLDSSSEDIARSEMNKKSVQNVLEYATDIIRYVEKLSLNKSLLQRNFYIIFSYHTSEITSGDKFTKEEIIDICFNELYTRAQGIISSLASCSVNAYLLDSNQLAELLYTSYDRDDSNIINIRQALESGYYRLYSTSHDAFQKRTELLDKQIAQEAEIKAYEALKKAIQEGRFVPEEVTENQIDEEISKKAIDVVKSQRVNESIKEKAKDIIIDDYKNNKNERIERLKKKMGDTSEEDNKQSKEEVQELNKEGISDQINRLENNDINKDIEEDSINLRAQKKAEIVNEPTPDYIEPAARDSVAEKAKRPPVEKREEITIEEPVVREQPKVEQQSRTVESKPQTTIVPQVPEEPKQERKEIVQEETKPEAKQEKVAPVPEPAKQTNSQFEESGLRSASRHFELDDSFDEKLQQRQTKEQEKKQEQTASEDTTSAEDEDELII